MVLKLSGNMKEVVNKKVTRFDILKVMNYLIMRTNDESIYDNWITYAIPDEANDIDIQEIADDDEMFHDTVNQFIKLSKYFKDGIEIEGVWHHGK